MAAANWVEDEEWELVNDDGFVYKRRKRPRLDPATTSALPAPDPAAEEKNRRERKKRVLLKLKTKYELEINRWEQVSNTLNAMEEKAAQNHQQQLLQHLHSASLDQTIISSLPPAKSSDSTCSKVVDGLLARAEAQEAIIRDISNLCELAEALCNAEEERFKKPFMDLPIWEPSPQELIASLCDN